MAWNFNMLFLTPLLFVASLCCCCGVGDRPLSNGSKTYRAQYQNFFFTGYEGEVDPGPRVDTARAGPNARLYIKFSEDSEAVAVSEIDVDLALKVCGATKLKQSSGNKNELVCAGNERLIYFEDNRFKRVSLSRFSDVLISSAREGPIVTLPITKSELIRLWGEPDEWSEGRARGYF